MLRPQDKRLGAQLVGAVAGAVVTGQQALVSDGLWQIITATAAVLFVVGVVLAVVGWRRKDTLVDAQGITLPGADHPIPWSRVERVTAQPRGSQQGHWFLVLTDGTQQRTDFTRGDDTLHRWWKERHG